MYTPNLGDDPFLAGRGELIGTLFQDDWQTFSEEVETNGSLQDLCVAILQAGLTKDDVDEPDYTDLFFQEDPLDHSVDDEWEERVRDLLTPSPRITTHELEALAAEGIFPEESYDRLEYILREMGRAYHAGQVLFRARIHEDRERRTRFDRKELGAPPADRARSGRANQQGQSVLYVATDPETAISEVRPWKGAPVAIGSVRVTRDVRIFDLTTLEPLESPFLDEEISWKLEARGLLWRLRDDLSRPVTPHDSDRQYQPSQYACELVREASFDGVAFPSAMGPGHNVVLFDPDAGEVLEVEYVRIRGVEYAHEPSQAAEIEVDEFPYD